MTQVMLKTKSSQSLRLTIGGITYETRIYEFRGLMYIDIMQGDEYILAGKRIMANQWLFPLYMTSGMGNVRFETYTSDSDSYVWYDGFNTKYRLMAYGRNEIPDENGS